MKLHITLVLSLLAAFTLSETKAQDQEPYSLSTAEKQIIKLMDEQEACWNEGNLDCFMKSYWKSDNLVFIGKAGPKYGWKTTLTNYRKSYPDKRAMGKLKFEIIAIDVLSGDSAFVIGKWQLNRKDGDLSGHFTLLWKRIEGQWVIVADHSS
ncbi:MAG: nuclear transport factor 2 family protein [Cyclobacteriaceae bacterium]